MSFCVGKSALLIWGLADVTKPERQASMNPLSPRVVSQALPSINTFIRTLCRTAPPIEPKSCSAVVLEPEWLVQVQFLKADRQLWHLLVVALTQDRSRLLQSL